MFKTAMTAGNRRSSPGLLRNSARIAVARPRSIWYGFFEKNVGRQGDLWMSDEKSPRLWSGRQVGIVRPDQPYKIDFVMVPAAAIEGRLVTDMGQSIANATLYLGGKELPPGCSVLYEVQTDKAGNFRFSPVPVGHSFFIEMNGVNSPEIQPDKPVDYRLKVWFVRRPDGRRILDVSQEAGGATQP